MNRTRAIMPVDARPAHVKHDIEHGCPFDCGPCESHTQKVRLPVVTITSACDLDCPICYVHNKNDDAYHMSREEFSQILDHLVNDHGGDLDIVNLTGGKPLMHPHLFDLIEMARSRGIHRVSVCSNGVRLARDEKFGKTFVRAWGAYCAFFRYLRQTHRSCNARRDACGL